MACRPRLQPVIPPANTRPVRVFSQDERRVGRLTIRRRRLTARGVPPIGSVQQVFAWCSVDAAVEPTTGDRCFLAWPLLNTAMLQRFVDAFAPALPERVTLLWLDNSGAQTSQRLTLPEHVQLSF